jgi:hypothetical protein
MAGSAPRECACGWLEGRRGSREGISGFPSTVHCGRELREDRSGCSATYSMCVSIEIVTYKGILGATDSRMLDSEGWAMINGGGFSWIALYSRVNCPHRQHAQSTVRKRRDDVGTRLFAALLAMASAEG